MVIDNRKSFQSMKTWTFRVPQTRMFINIRTACCFDWHEKLGLGEFGENGIRQILADFDENKIWWKWISAKREFQSTSSIADWSLRNLFNWSSFGRAAGGTVINIDGNRTGCISAVLRFLTVLLHNLCISTILLFKEN